MELRYNTLSERKTNGFLNRPIFFLDWVIFFSLAVFCYFVFLHGDILCTCGSSISYLGGHITDFYEYNPENGVELMNNYLPSTYILFAIWNIPIYLLNLVSCPMTFVEDVSLFTIFWYKALPVIFFFASAIVVFKIGRVLGFGLKKSRLLAFIFLTTPIGFFSPLIFGQYDSFTLFFTLLGVYFYFKDDAFKFVVFFAIAMTFKYFAFLIFLPLLLLREKKILKIFGFCFLFLVPCLLEILFYISSKNFNMGVLGFKAANYLFAGEINLRSMHPSIFLIGWVFVLFWAYFKKFEKGVKEDFFKWAIYFCNIVIFFIFGLSMWHPQWLIFMVPFSILGSIINKKAKVFFMVDSVMFLVFVLLCISLWRGSVDEFLMDKGILKNYIDFDTELTTSILDFLPNISIAVCDWLFACFSGLLLAGAVFKHPNFTVLDFKEKLNGCGLVLRIRMFCIFLFWILPCVLCVLISKGKGDRFFVKNSEYLAVDGNIGGLEPGKCFSQYFVVPNDINYLDELRVSFNTGEKINDYRIQIFLEDVEAKKILFSKEYETYKFKNIVPTKFGLEKIPVEKNKLYSFNFKMLDDCVEEKNKEYKNVLTINKTKLKQDSKYKKLEKLDKVFGGEFAAVDGKKKKYNLSLDILGK